MKIKSKKKRAKKVPTKLWKRLRLEPVTNNSFEEYYAKTSNVEKYRTEEGIELFTMAPEVNRSIFCREKDYFNLRKIYG